MRRVGLIGGTFDPIHNGHVLLALFTRETLDLDEVIFIPAADPPHKDSTHAKADQRMDMVKMAIAGVDGFSASRIELDRPGKSYTSIRYASCMRTIHTCVFLIIGSDNVRKCRLGTIRLASWIMRGRCGWRTKDADVDPAWLSYALYDTPLIELSSTHIRQRLQDGLAVRGMIPDSVECYIGEKGIYKPCI